MADFTFYMQLMDAMLLPIIGGGALGLVKLTTGARARDAERNYYVLLAMVTLVTVRTVVNCDPAWLIHTSTLAVMVVGGLAIPGQNSILGASPNRVSGAVEAAV